MTASEPELEEFEARGFFLHLPFEGEEDRTVLYVAHKDFDSLQGIIENPDTSWEDFREEIFSLLEHSGHDQDHELSRSATEEIMDLVAAKELPEEPEIEDPLEDLNSDES